MLGWLKSAWNYTCPRCRKRKMFIEPFEFSKPLRMHEICEHCTQRFEPEPGFYYGAMFISYIISAFVLLGVALTLVFYFKWSVNGAMGIVLFLSAISYFKILRLSRSLYIHVIVGYKPPRNQ